MKNNIRTVKTQNEPENLKKNREIKMPPTF